MEVRPAVVVHGGTGNLPEVFTERYNHGVRLAVKAGYDALLKSGSAVDAVCAAVYVMEEDDIFNCGKGSALTEEKSIEMDAFVMDGSNLKTGAVACVENILHPVLLAKDVMEKTSHCFLAARGALSFARKMGHKIVQGPKELLASEEIMRIKHPPNTSFNDFLDRFVNTPTQLNQEPTDDKNSSSTTEVWNVEKGHDTVGAVSIDSTGRIACATSTGGIPFKMIGRVGDSPLIGCGGYANDVGGAVSTGHGESFMRTTICREAVFYMQRGASAQEATNEALKFTFENTGGRGGMIALDCNGDIGISLSSYHMPWAYIRNGYLHTGHGNGEDVVKEL